MDEKRSLPVKVRMPACPSRVAKPSRDTCKKLQGKRSVDGQDRQDFICRNTRACCTRYDRYYGQRRRTEVAEGWQEALPYLEVLLSSLEAEGLECHRNSARLEGGMSELEMRSWWTRTSYPK